MNAKELEAVVISDVHLGTYGCKAEELLIYLKSIRTKRLILNGDIIDVWQFSTNYFPKSHMKVIRYIIKMMEKGTMVYYLPGNHDEVFRRFVGTKMGNLEVQNKLLLKLDGKTSWIFHGDVFDVVMHHSKWLAKVGAQCYGFLTLTNRFANFWLSLFGEKKISLARDVKKAVKGKGSITTRFEMTVAELAIAKNYQYAICGHIHWPDKKLLHSNEGAMTYLNSGDWVENLTALEYYDGDWHLFKYSNENAISISSDELATVDDDFLSTTEKHLFQSMMKDVLLSR